MACASRSASTACSEAVAAAKKSRPADAGLSPRPCLPQSLLENRFLLGARAEHRTDLGAVRLGLGCRLGRALQLGADLIELAAEVVERRPVLVLGDQEDVRVVGSASL